MAGTKAEGGGIDRRRVQDGVVGGYLERVTCFCSPRSVPLCGFEARERPGAYAAAGLKLLDDIMLPADDRRPVQLDGAGGRAEPRRVLHQPVNAR